MHKFNLSQSLKNNYIIYIFIISSLINSILLLLMTTGLGNIRFIISDLVILLIISSLAFLIKKRHRYFLIISLILSTICCINSLYYNNYNDFASIYLLATLPQAFKLPSEAVTSIFQINDFIFIWQVLLFILLYRKKNYEKNTINFKRTFVLTFTLLVIILLSCNSNDIYRLTHDWNKSYVVHNFGIYSYQINDLFVVGKRLICPNCGKDDAQVIVDDYFKNGDSLKNEYTDIFKDKNVLFIHAESVQQMFLNQKIGNQTITPNLNKLAKEGLYFSNYYSQESVGTSSDTEFTITNSILPIGTGTVFINYDDNNYQSMIKSFKKIGYYTFSMHGNNCEYWNRNKMYQALGYDNFYCYDDYNLNDKIGIGLSDKSFFSQSADMIKDIHDNYDKFYGTLIMLTNHTPFYTDGKVEFDVGKMEGTKMGNYLKLLHYADEAIGEFITKLDSLGVLEDTVIVIYGDHDAKFSIKDYEKYLSRDIDFYEYEQLTRVPLIIWTKDKQVQGEINKIMGAYDVMPTLANMFNFDYKYALGHDIFSIDDNIVVFPNGNWVTDKVYYNNQLSNYKLYSEVNKEYLKENEVKAKKIIEISNYLIRYNLFKE